MKSALETLAELAALDDRGMVRPQPRRMSASEQGAFNRAVLEARKRYSTPASSRKPKPVAEYGGRPMLSFPASFPKV
jgi:hypothetical protein